MSKIRGKFRKNVNTQMDYNLWDRLFRDVCRATEKEGKSISVAEIVRRILYKHYKK